MFLLIINTPTLLPLGNILIPFSLFRLYLIFVTKLVPIVLKRCYKYSFKSILLFLLLTVQH